MKRTTPLSRALLPVLAALTLSSPALARGSDPSVATANFASCDKPVWPEAALAAKRTGEVTLGFDVDAAGKIMDSRVLRSSGHADLDEAARVGISKCTFKAGMKDGQPVKSSMRMKYIWTLK